MPRVLSIFNELHNKAKVVHLDIQPSNILIYEQNDKKILELTDFLVVKFKIILIHPPFHRKKKRKNLNQI